MQFPIPSFSFATHVPPIQVHPQGHFWLSREYAFEPRATAYSPVNAWWLAEAALLAYHDESAIRERLPASWSLDAFLDRGATQAFVAASTDAVIVSFRGTELRNTVQFFKDWLQNFDLELTGEGGAQCHCGFRDGVNLVYDELAAILGQLAPAPVWFTGHSLGAALATVAARRYRKAQGLYTFGSPRVGDADYCNHFPTRVWRIVNDSDPVAHVPGMDRGYSHVGAPLWIDPNGRLHETEPATPPANPIDHAPILYSIHLANQLF